MFRLKTQVFVIIIKCSEPDTHYCACKLDIEYVKGKERCAVNIESSLHFTFTQKILHENVLEQVLAD